MSRFHYRYTPSWLPCRKNHLQQMQLTSTHGSQYSCWENDSIPNLAALNTLACMPLLPNVHINLAFLCYHSATTPHSYAHIHAPAHATNSTIGACFPSNSLHSKDRSLWIYLVYKLNSGVAKLKPIKRSNGATYWLGTSSTELLLVTRGIQ